MSKNEDDGDQVEELLWENRGQKSILAVDRHQIVADMVSITSATERDFVIYVNGETEAKMTIFGSASHALDTARRTAVSIFRHRILQSLRTLESIVDRTQHLVE